MAAIADDREIKGPAPHVDEKTDLEKIRSANNPLVAKALLAVNDLTKQVLSMPAEHQREIANRPKIQQEIIKAIPTTKKIATITAGFAAFTFTLTAGGWIGGWAIPSLVVGAGTIGAGVLLGYGTYRLVRYYTS